MARASKDKIQELLDLCEALEWQVQKTASVGRKKVIPPSGDPIYSPASGNGHGLANFRKDLERAGFNEEEAIVRKAEKAKAAMEADREKNELRLEEAAARAKKTAVPPASALTVNPFQPPVQTGGGFVISSAHMATAEHVQDEAQVMAAYPHEVVYVTIEWAASALERKQCKQRPINQRKVNQWLAAMKNGEWALNPADSLVFDEHNCLLNGQHRLSAVFLMDEQEMRLLYPHGIPFYVTYNFPSRLAHIFDTGKARSAPDALAVEGLKGWGPMQSAALRLVLSYDRSFKKGGEKNWGRWKNIQYSHGILTEAAHEYADLLNHGSMASSLNNYANMIRSSALAGVYLINRDNPDGDGTDPNKEAARTNERFFWGVCGRGGLEDGDPRIACTRVTSHGTTNKRMQRREGAAYEHLLAMLHAYAAWQLKKKMYIFTPDEKKPMPRVWQPGRKWLKNDEGELILRFEKNDPRYAKEENE